MCNEKVTYVSKADTAKVTETKIGSFVDIVNPFVNTRLTLVELCGEDVEYYRIITSEPVKVFAEYDTNADDDEAIQTYQHVQINGQPVVTTYNAPRIFHYLTQPHFEVKNDDIISLDCHRNTEVTLHFMCPVTYQLCEPVIFEEQGGEMEAPQELHASDTKTKLQVNKEESIVTPDHDIIQTSSDGTESAIESVDITPGETSSRVTTQMMTPSGLKTVIHMTDKTPINSHKVEHLMGASLPLWSQVWQELDTAKTRITPSVNNRIVVQMNNFTHYKCLHLFRIVAPVPLFVSARYWISYTPDNGSGVPFENIGFEWNPSEEAEVFVLVPWTASSAVLPIETPSQMGLSITELAPVIFSAGQPTSITYRAYYTPIDMELFTPKISPVIISPDVQTLVSIEEAIATKIIATQKFVLGIRTMVRLDKLSSSTITVAQFTANLTDSAFWIDGTENETEFPPGTYDIVSTNVERSQVYLMYTGIGSMTVETIPSAKIKVENNSIFEEQIEGYTYNEKNSFARSIMGSLGDHTQRLDSHWGEVDTIPINSVDDSISIDLSNTKSAYIYQDLLRHLFSAKYPIMQIRFTSIPTANLIVRLTQLPPGVTSVTRNGALELPGFEFDIKSGDNKIAPYWNHVNPVLRTDNYDSPYFQLDVLGGSMGAEPVYVTFMINPASIEYYHLATSDFQNVKRVVVPKVKKPLRLKTKFREEGAESDPQVITSTAHYDLNNQNAGVIDSEARWQYVDSFQIAPNTGTIRIPINKSILGKFFFRHSSRYHFWRGTPRVKIMFTNAKIVNGNIHVVQSSRVPADGDNPAIFMEESGYSVASTSDQAIVMDLKWRTAEINLRTQFENTIGDLPELDNLLILIPELSVGTLATIPQNIVCTIHVDPSNIQLSLPSRPWSEYDPIGVYGTTRPAARII